MLFFHKALTNTYYYVSIKPVTLIRGDAKKMWNPDVWRPILYAVAIGFLGCNLIMYLYRIVLEYRYHKTILELKHFIRRELILVSIGSLAVILIATFFKPSLNLVIVSIMNISLVIRNQIRVRRVERGEELG